MNKEEIHNLQGFMEVFMIQLMELKESILFNDDSAELEAQFLITRKLAIHVISKSMSNIHPEMTTLEKIAKRERLLEIVCECAEVDKETLLTSKSRITELKIPRQVYMALVHKVLGVTLKVAAATFSMDHASALHSYKAVKNDYKSSKYFREKYKDAINFCYEYDTNTGNHKTRKYLYQK